MGKFARVCLKTPNIDYNGRLCMVSAGAGEQEGVRHRPRRQPVVRHPRRRGHLDRAARTSPSARRSRPTTSGRRASTGAKIIVVDPRITPIARTCDLFLPVKPGRDAALFNGILHLMIEHDWLDHDVHRRATRSASSRSPSTCREWTPRRTAEVTGIAERAIRAGGRDGGGRRRPASCCTRAASSTTSHGVQNVLGAINLVLASGRIGRPKLRLRTITGQANGQGGREHGQKCDQLPGGRDIENPEHRAYIAGVWGIDRAELPRPGVDCLRDLPQDRHAARSRACCRSASTRWSRCRTTTSSRAVLEKLEFYVAIDFFLNETARHADIVLPGSLQEEDEGTVTQVEGRVIKINKAVDCPARRGRTGGSSRTSPQALGRPHGLHVRRARARSSTSCASPAGRRRRLLGHHLREDRAADRRVLAVSRAGRRPIDTRARRGCSSRARRTRSRRAPGRSTSPTARRASTSPTTGRRPRTSTTSIPIILTTGRVVSQFLSGTQTRRIGPLVDQYPSRASRCTRGWPRKLGIADGDWATAETPARRRSRCARRS